MDDEQDRKMEGVIQLGRGLRREVNKEEEEGGRAIPHPFSGGGSGDFMATRTGTPDTKRM